MHVLHVHSSCAPALLASSATPDVFTSGVALLASNATPDVNTQARSFGPPKTNYLVLYPSYIYIRTYLGTAGVRIITISHLSRNFSVAGVLALADLFL